MDQAAPRVEVEDRPTPQLRKLARALINSARTKLAAEAAAKRRSSGDAA